MSEPSLTTLSSAGANPHYEKVGGAKALELLVERFYREMSTDPAMSDIRQLHPDNLEESKQRLFQFLSGWLGGPKLYEQRFGPPRLRRSHLAFPIGVAERDQWLTCMERALASLDIDPGFQHELMASFFRTADFLRNQQET